MNTTYTENGVQYDVAGLISTARGMSEKEMIKRILLFNINGQIMREPNDIRDPNIPAVDYMDYQITNEVRWVVDHVMRLTAMASNYEQKLIYNFISSSL